MPSYAPPTGSRALKPPLSNRHPDYDALATMRDRRAWWLRHLMQWHWISSAICLIGMLLFSVTGITLNHPNAIKVETHVERAEIQIGPAMRDTLARIAESSPSGPLPPVLRRWLADELGQPVPTLPAEWSSDEIYLAMPRPGGDAWLSIDLATGTVEYERVDRGTVAWLNDLHKGRNTGPAWSLFIDLFALACIVFSLTGLAVLWIHARQRPLVWPMVGLGALIPLLIIVLFMH